MKVILSTTFDDLYYFFLPITIWSWKKLGIDTICFVPTLPFPDALENKKLIQKIYLIQHFTKQSGIRIEGFKAPDYKQATYAQCSRLYAAALNDLPEDEILITGDVDMVGLNKEYFEQANDGQIHAFGADLVPEKQYAICYLAMPVKTWREVMWIRPQDTPQTKLDDLLGHIECEHFRGNLWARDQEEIFNHLTGGAWPVVKHFRASPGTQFATRRADRDGWPQVFAPDLIDAHLPREGFTDENFAKILNLFTAMYPNENFDWMVAYRNEYIKLINQ